MKPLAYSPADSIYGIANAHADYSSVTSAASLQPPPEKTRQNVLQLPPPPLWGTVPRQGARAWFRAKEKESLD